MTKYNKNYIKNGVTFLSRCGIQMRVAGVLKDKFEAYICGENDNRISVLYNIENGNVLDSVYTSFDFERFVVKYDIGPMYIQDATDKNMILIYIDGVRGYDLMCPRKS